MIHVAVWRYSLTTDLTGFGIFGIIFERNMKIVRKQQTEIKAFTL